MNIDAFKKAITDIQQAMDNSSDTRGAIGLVLLTAYTMGVREGAVQGYNAGFKDGRRAGVANRSSAVGAELRDRARADALTELGVGIASSDAA